MCKICDLETWSESAGEKSNGCNQIVKIKDGSQMFDICLNRYILESEHIHTASLILGTYAISQDGQHPVKEKQVKIKYCPFCGKEL